jgi:ubiquinone/menaquinone biosynthesis C-methylase UbiE
MTDSVKDLFSSHADIYAKYRPLYPKELYEFLLKHVYETNAALDCGTGNGQCAAVLAAHFKTVEATDISDKQIQQAVVKPNLHYHVCRAEQTPFADNQFDLITCATAVHWFQFDKFFTEMKRVAKNNAVFACWAYNLLKTDKDELNKIIKEFYWQTIYRYWDPERSHVDAEYKTIPFPFEEIANPGFVTQTNWDLDTLRWYLLTWSAVQHYIHENKDDPLNELMKRINLTFDNNIKLKITFPIFMRIGIIKK